MSSGYTHELECAGLVGDGQYGPMERKYTLPPYRVVVAEDNQVLRELLVQQLEEHGHDVVGVAATGLEVVEVVGRTLPDVAVIDRGLPEQDGLAASRDISRLSPTAVLVLSGYVSRTDPEEEAEEAGAQVFLAKPYTIEELQDAMEYAVRRFSARNQPERPV